MKKKFLLFALAMASVAACADEPVSGSTGDDDDDDKVAPGDDDDDAPAAGGECAPESEDEGDVIADFEAGAMNNAGGRWDGYWYRYNDLEMNDVDEVQTIGVEADEERCGESTQVLCTTAAEAFTVWGGGIGVDLNGNLEMKNAIDLSDYKGIQFWIKKRGGSASSVQVGITEKNSAKDGGYCDQVEDDDTEACMPFTTSGTVTSKWRKIQADFGKLVQGTWGKASEEKFQTDAVYGIQLQFPKDADFDVCIDNVELYK